MSQNLQGKSSNMNRRQFLKLGAAVAGTTLAIQTLPTPAYAKGTEVPGYERMGMLTDLAKCIGCRACEAACNRVNNLPHPEVPFSDTSVFETLRRPTTGAFTVVNRYPDPDGGPPVYRKVQCMHCSEPACVSVCPVAAMVKTPEGPALWDERVCFGCRYCMIACPFSIPAYEYSSAFSPRVRKCTMCYARVFKEGGVPACAEACAVGATIFGKRDELIQMAHQRFLASPTKYVNHIYGEQEAGGTSWLYISPVSFEQVGLPKVESTSYGDLTWDFLTVVPLVLVLWPLFMAGLHRFAQRREEVAVAEALKKATQREKEGQR